MKAHDMRLKAEKARKNAMQIQLEEIYQKIENAAAKGEMYLGEDGDLRDEVRQQLLEEGFYVTTGMQYNTPWYMIRWDRR